MQSIGAKTLADTAPCRRGMATYVGRDTAKLKAKGGKFKYMSEQEMVSIASKFSPYRYVGLRPSPSGLCDTVLRLTEEGQR